MKTRKFKTDFLKKELGLPWNAIQDEIVDQDRWSTYHDIIFEFENKFYKGWYREGSTEMQDEAPWEYDDILECTEVEKKEVVVEKWITVED